MVTLHGRFRITRGPLAGLAGKVVSILHGNQCLLKTEIDGLHVRVSSEALRPVPLG